MLITLNKFLLGQDTIARLNSTVKRLDKKGYRKLSIDVATWGLFDTFIMNLPVDKLARGYSPGGLETISDIKKVNFKGIQHIILVFIVFVVNFEYLIATWITQLVYFLYSRLWAGFYPLRKVIISESEFLFVIHVFSYSPMGLKIRWFVFE